MIRVRCRTNLDNFKCKVWPDQFCCRPVIGDTVRSEDGQTLTICGITHSMDARAECLLGDVKRYPILIIELNK